MTPEPGRTATESARSSAQRESLEAVWFDRDLGWIEFNHRVLAEALDERTPLLERVKFLAIFGSNLDEFFMKRIAVLRERATPERLRLLAQIRSRLDPLLRQQADYFQRRLLPELAEHGICLRAWDQLSAAQRAEACSYFDAQIFAALTPLTIEAGRPFPFFSNLSLSLSFRLEDQRTGESAHARIKVPPALAAWVLLSADTAPGERVFVRLHEIIRENASKLYPGMRLSAPSLFRLTRDAEVELQEHSAQGLRELVREQIRQRRFEPVVRLELAPGADPELLPILRERFALDPREIYELAGELDYTSLFQIASLPFPELRDPHFVPIPPLALADGQHLFEAIQRGDLLVHHPYESFDDSVERFIRAAADDPATVAIKMTVYRVGDDTPFVRSLIRAAESGKQVACVIELKARFDEERNLHWASELERAGAHVSVGDVRLKTHAKLALVVRKEASGLRSYAHIGTGNYNHKTARLYTDVGLFTADPVLTNDVASLFHHLTGHSELPAFRSLLVAPRDMRERFLARIQGEIEHRRAGRPARIIAKMNQLEDPAMIAALCEASAAGVPIDLIVRGFCCLRPGVSGASDTIRVRSIVGRFLEHSRIFWFASGKEDPLDGEYFIGSADWMTRNLSQRVEVVAPVSARSARERLQEILDLSLRDRRHAWVMDEKGEYTQEQPGSAEDGPEAFGVQRALIELMEQRSADGESQTPARG